MPIDFKYVPVSGPLAGRSFEEQTERAFNELGANIDNINAAADEAVTIAENAQTTSIEALDAANTAVTAAQHAETSAQDAKNVADSANATAQSAQGLATEALDTASTAQNTADLAREVADSAATKADAAKTEAEQAELTAISAEELARSAFDLQSGSYTVITGAVDADTIIEGRKIYAATSLVNSAVPAPAYLTVMPNNEQTSVTQEVWAENTPSIYMRTGLIAWTANAGSDAHMLNAIPVSGTTVSGTLTVSQTGTALNAAFLPGGFSGAPLSAFLLDGIMNFDVGPDFTGSIMHADTEVELIRVTDGEAAIIGNTLTSPRSKVTLLSAAYAGNTVSVNARIEWRNKTYSVTWGSWGTSGAPIMTATALGIGRPDNITLEAVGGVIGVKPGATYSQMITASGNITLPCTGYWGVERQGGGGGGGSHRRSGTSGFVAAGGGASGGYLYDVIYATKGTTVLCAIGAGGNYGDVASSGTGYKGGDTSFGTLPPAEGGSGGRGYYDPNSGMAYCAYGGQAPVGGQPGGTAYFYSRTISTGLSTDYAYTGCGGSSMFGAGGFLVLVSNTINTFVQGNPGTGYGSGGSGGGGWNATGNGGAGAPGCIRITFLGV